MLSIAENKYLIQRGDSLPSPREDRLYLDVETVSGNPKHGGLCAHLGDRIAGFSVTWNTANDAWYVPLRHKNSDNIDLEIARKWLLSVITTACNWTNHNIKFDMHFVAAENIKLPSHDAYRYICTVVSAKLLDTNRGFGRGGYGLDALVRDWCKYDITASGEKMHGYLKSIGSKDYGDAPADLTAEYACEDVVATKRLDEHISTELIRQENMGLHRVANTETLLTPVLFDIECEGLRVDPNELQLQEFKTLCRLAKLEAEIDTAAGYPIRPHVSGDCHDLFCNKLGFRVLEWTPKGGPSFAYSALKAYSTLPEVVMNEKYSRLVDAILEYKDLYALLNMFIRSYQTLHSGDGVLHPNYNQVLVTGRMSCTQPNVQQLNYDARCLIHPPPGEAFLSADWSQIEFRLIAHYIIAVEVLSAYAKNPDIDFHTWVAEMCGIDRDPAKSVNFATGYGAGKNKIFKMLSSNPTLVKFVNTHINTSIEDNKLDSHQRVDAFHLMIMTLVEDVYNKYHEVLPTLKTTIKQAERVCRSRGYVFNIYGRRRHLTSDLAWLSFNALCQGSAADIGKEKLVSLSPRNCAKMREWGIRIAASVHDEILFVGPPERLKSPDVLKYIANDMEHPSVELRVPIRVKFGYSEKNWAEASKESKVDRTAWDLDLIRVEDE